MDRNSLHRLPRPWDNTDCYAENEDASVQCTLTEFMIFNWQSIWSPPCVCVSQLVFSCPNYLGILNANSGSPQHFYIVYVQWVQCVASISLVFDPYITNCVTSLQHMWLQPYHAQVIPLLFQLIFWNSNFYKSRYIPVFHAIHELTYLPIASPFVCNHQIVVSITASPSKTSDVKYTSLLPSVYEDVINLIACFSVRRSPNVFINFAMW
jgi:hypothetical protein